MVLPDGVVGVVLDLNNGENNDTSPTTWEVALESKMKTLQGRTYVGGGQQVRRAGAHATRGPMSIRR